VWSEAKVGLRFVAGRPGLVGLLLFFALSNYTLGLVEVLMPPLLLAISNPATYGRVMSLGGLGMVVGALAMGAWGGPRQRVAGILLLTCIQAVALVAGGLRPDVVLIAVTCFVVMAVLPIIWGTSQSLWQVKTPPDLQGRVSAIRTAAATCTLPIAYATAGPLADKVFEPLLQPGGMLSDSVGAIIGVGRGRGIGFMSMVLGTDPLGLALAGWMHPRLRHLETELPDELQV
jgi:hypothetical protein